MGSTMKTSQKQYKSVVSKAVLTLFVAAGLSTLAPVAAQAGNVGWAVSVGGGYGGGYGAGYYAPPVVYASPPVVTYAAPQQPMVLASQPQPPVWYYCEASGQYFPYVQSCASGWQTQPAMPPSGSAPTRQRIQN